MTRLHSLTCLATTALLGLWSCRIETPKKAPLARSASLDSVRAMARAHAMLGPAARAQLDTGNAFFRRHDFASALARYRAAAALAPQHAAPLFGIYMVGRATHDSLMADSALAGIRLRNGPMPSLPHSLPDSALQRMHEVIRRQASAG